MSSFQALWGGSDVAAAGRPGGESLGRGGAGEAARAAGGPRPDRRLGAGRGAAGADRGAPGPGGAGARPRGAGARPADDRAADVRAVEGARAPLRLGLRDADARGLRLAAAAAVLPDEEVPDESTVRKLTRRLGAELVAELSRLVRAKAQRETRLRARAVRIDSTVVEADVRDPTDAGLAGGGVRTLARAGKRLRAKLGATTTTVRDRSRAVAKRLRALARTLRRRTGEGRAARADGADGEAARRLGAGGAACGRRGVYEGAGTGPLAEGEGKAERGQDPRERRLPGDAGGAQRGRRRADPQASGRRADRGSPRLAVRPRCAADPHGQAGQDDRVWLCRAAGRGNAEHETGGARLDRAAGLGAGQPRRERASAHDGARAAAARAQTTRGRARRRLPDEGEHRDARAACAQAHLHRQNTETQRRSPCSSYFPRRAGPACRGRLFGGSS